MQTDGQVRIGYGLSRIIRTLSIGEYGYSDPWDHRSSVRITGFEGSGWSVVGVTTGDASGR